MKNHITFKQYMESKDILKQSLNETPKQTKKYNITTYRTLINELESVSVKPDYQIEVKWDYKNIESPSILNFILYDRDNNKILEKSEFNELVSNKIKKWIDKNI
jgi:hypothetical protein